MATDRPVFGEDYRMLPEWLRLGVAGKFLAEITGKKRPYLRRRVEKLFKDHELPVYSTPLGKLVHYQDVLELARRLGWWRREPIQGYLGEFPWCEASRASVRVPTGVTAEQVFEYACRVCGRTMLVHSTLQADGSLSGRLPTHKDLRNRGSSTDQENPTEPTSSSGSSSLSP